MTGLDKKVALTLLFCILLLFVVPPFYIALLNKIISHPGLRFSDKWSDNAFSDWETSRNSPVIGGISNEGGALKVNMEGERVGDEIIAAQKTKDLPADLASNDYVRVSIMASSIDVAARIVIWTDFQHSHEILAKTYNDSKWHQEIILLSFFKLSGNVSMIELSIKQLTASNATEWILYKDLAFGNLDL